MGGLLETGAVYRFVEAGIEYGGNAGVDYLERELGIRFTWQSHVSLTSEFGHGVGFALPWARKEGVRGEDLYHSFRADHLLGRVLDELWEGAPERFVCPKCGQPLRLTAIGHWGYACATCKASGDVVQFVEHVRECSEEQAEQWLGEQLGQQAFERLWRMRDGKLRRPYPVGPVEGAPERALVVDLGDPQSVAEAFYNGAVWRLVEAGIEDGANRAERFLNTEFDVELTWEQRFRLNSYFLEGIRYACERARHEGVSAQRQFQEYLARSLPPGAVDLKMEVVK